jgi:hypothetical protein
VDAAFSTSWRGSESKLTGILRRGASKTFVTGFNTILRSARRSATRLSAKAPATTRLIPIDFPADIAMHLLRDWTGAGAARCDIERCDQLTPLTSSALQLVAHTCDKSFIALLHGRGREGFWASPERRLFSIPRVSK